MKPLLHNRILMLGLALSILLHGLLLLILPEGTFLSGKMPEIQPGMELRFVLRDRLPVMSEGGDSLTIGETASDNSHIETISSGTSGIRQPEGKSSPVQTTGNLVGGASSDQRDIAGAQTSPASDGIGYEGTPETGEDSRSVVFRRGAGRQASSTGRPIITASTRDPAYAMYYRALRSRIEHIGNINFPQRNGARLYGELTVRIPVYKNGTIEEREGGVSIARSSGNPALDNAALNIVRRAAPFGPFPGKAQTTADVWVIITRLKFTQDQGHHPQIQSTVR